MQFHLYLPQMRMAPSQLVERAQAAEAAGFLGIAGMDHLAPPRAESQPMYGAMTTSTWLAARHVPLIVSSLVLSDPFRHPAVLAQEAVSIDHFSGGRFELGIGWGSGAHELAPYGVTADGGAATGETARRDPRDPPGSVDRGTRRLRREFFVLRGARQTAVPLDHIPLVIGGAGPKTMALVAAHADWWNLHIAILDRFDEMRSRAAGDARVSMEHMVAFVPSEDRARGGRRARPMKRFGTMGVVTGDTSELIDYFGTLGDRGVERVYAWFTDFADPATLAAFGDTVIPALA